MTGNGDTAWEAYRRGGCERAARLGNRGPMRFDEDGRLAQDILDAYRRTGFYVFTGVLSPQEVTELGFGWFPGVTGAGVLPMAARFPRSPNACRTRSP